MSIFPYQRLAIIGVTGSGKSTLADRIAQHFGLNRLELDDLFWKPNWQQSNPEEFRAKVEQAVQAKRWVSSGNYSEARELIWHRAETIIWLDYSLPRVLFRLWKRTWSRWWKREFFCNGNRERWLKHLKIWSDDSIFHWLFKTYWSRKRMFSQAMASVDFGHVQWFRFKHPRQLETWFQEFTDQN